MSTYTQHHHHTRMVKDIVDGLIGVECKVSEAVNKIRIIVVRPTGITYTLNPGIKESCSMKVVIVLSGPPRSLAVNVRWGFEVVFGALVLVRGK